MEADQRLRNSVMIEQFAGLARVFAGDAVHFLQRPQRAERDILEIADRRGHDVKSSAHLSCTDPSDYDKSLAHIENTSATGIYQWECPGKPHLVRLSLDVVDRMQQDVMRGF